MESYSKIPDPMSSLFRFDHHVSERDRHVESRFGAVDILLDGPKRIIPGAAGREAGAEQPIPPAGREEASLLEWRYCRP